MEVAVSNANSLVTFTGDKPSNLPDPYFVAKAGESYAVNLLIGKTYRVTSAQPITCTAKSSDDIIVDQKDERSMTIVYPVSYEIVDNARSLARQVKLTPPLVGMYTWNTNTCCETEKEDGPYIPSCATYGTNTGTNDEALVQPSYVIGRYTGKLPSLGNFFAFVKTTPGYIVCILVPFLLLILYNGTNVIRLFRKYKKEQTAEMEAEKAELAAERKQNEEMLLELMRLKEQLNLQANGAQAPTATQTPSDIAEEPSVSAEEAPASSEDSSINQ